MILYFKVCKIIEVSQWYHQCSECFPLFFSQTFQSQIPFKSVNHKRQHLAIAFH